MHFKHPGPEALGSRADLLRLGGDGHSEMDMLEDLETLQSEYALPEEERTWLFLKGRSRGLMVEACAHATFFCKLYRILRQSLHENQTSGHVSTGSPIACEELNVGIIGGGHLGKQLARVLLQLVPIPTESLRISTRRPEVLDELQKLGIQCFYQNSYLVNWANVVFLCCLPSQLPNICLEIQSSLEKTCIVYSFVAAIPVPRLKLLLNHTNILRPQYQCAGKFVNIWGANKEITAALRDPVILRATCPYSPAGGITLNIKWLEGVFYAALNICTAKEMSHPRVLQLLSEQFLSAHSGDCGKDSASCPKFQLTDFVSKTYAKNLPLRRPFPWFDLAAVQLKETPFSLRLSKSTALQDHLTHFYCHLFGISLFKDQPEVSTGSPSQ
ncbi:NADP-dependent oxidoreductase domain-containing protein 1 [Elephas maximus indicus]|uniref:NADP-dependent oxidoreductase domain-containing protein 1 n=1 Tax=Elephas maximus indicus TaxID=99487 RepID=UPI002116CE8E|nr:NADP-dependent oxidoreductase domain-containing protein 1 [Elephas maximus indicus]